MKKSLWPIIVFLTGVFVFIASSTIVARELPAHFPYPPDAFRVEKFPNFVYFSHEGSIVKMDEENQIPVFQLGDGGWLRAVHVEKIYAISKPYLIVEGVFEKEQWAILTSLDENGEISFGRYIIRDAHEVRFESNEPWVGDFYFTDSQGKQFTVNARGDLFGPKIPVG